jgi:DNA-3-methyladenine glycosylase II
MRNCPDERESIDKYPRSVTDPWRTHMQEMSFTLRPVPPFSLELTAWALRRRPNNEVDRWDGTNYSRILVIDRNAVKVSLYQEGGLFKPILHAKVVGANSDLPTIKSKISSIMGKMFSIKNDLKEFYLMAGGDKKLKPLAERFEGMKPPRFPTIFEALINAFSCQQVSLDLGIILLNRLSSAHGVVFREGSDVFHAFPRPEDLVVLSTQDLRKLGFSRNKGNAIIELSERVIAKQLEIESIEKMSDSEIIEYLSRIRGVGRWSSEYTLLRGLGRINMFPGDDVGAQKNLQVYMGLRERPDYDKIKSIALRWQPYAGFVYFHFLLDKLITKGYLRRKAL